MDELTPALIDADYAWERLTILAYEVRTALKAGVPVVLTWTHVPDPAGGPRSLGQEFRVLIGRPAVDWEVARLVDAVRGAPVAPVEATTPPAATSAGSVDVEDGTGPG